MKPYVLDTASLPDWKPELPPLLASIIGGTLGIDLGKASGSQSLGAWLITLPEGARSSCTHAHSAEEEMIFILSGECSLRIIEPGQEATETPVRAGFFISFPAGTGIAHSFINRSASPVRLLAIGERKPGVDKVRYPEHPEIAAMMRARAPGRIWDE